MNFFDFNAKVNLPKICESLGMKDLNFNFVPQFGWFAYKDDLSFVGTVFDVFDLNQRNKIYNLITQNKPELLNFHIDYSPFTENKVNKSYLTNLAWTVIFLESKGLVGELKLKSGMTLEKQLQETGYSNFLENNVGIISEELLERAQTVYPFINFGHIKNQILMPTWISPKHINGMYIIDPNNLNEKRLVYSENELGWLGQYNEQVLNSYKDLLYFKGVTWNKYLNYWKKKIELHSQLHIQTIIDIWTQKKVKVEPHPIDFVFTNNRQDELYTHIHLLNHSQVTELKIRKNVDKLEEWAMANQQKVNINGNDIVQKNNSYFLQRGNEFIQISDFVIWLEVIQQHLKFFNYKGHILYKDKIIPFIWKDVYFENHNKFLQKIRNTMLTTGTGIPYINPMQEKQLLQIVLMFNKDTPILQKNRQETAG